MAAKALATNDPVNSALAAQNHLDTVNWLKNVGYKADILGMKYYVGPNCSSGYYVPSLCDGGQDYNFEPNRAAALAYARTGNTAYRDFSDLMFNNYWAKPGTCPVGSSLCKEMASYGATGFDDTGYYMTAVSPGGRGSKWFGGAWGFSASASIPRSSISVTVPPIATHFSVTASGAATASASFGFTVSALDAGNNLVTGYTGTVHFSSTDSTATLPANATLDRK